MKAEEDQRLHLLVNQEDKPYPNSRYSIIRIYCEKIPYAKLMSAE